MKINAFRLPYFTLFEAGRQVKKIDVQLVSMPKIRAILAFFVGVFVSVFVVTTHWLGQAL